MIVQTQQDNPDKFVRSARAVSPVGGVDRCGKVDQGDIDAVPGGHELEE